MFFFDSIILGESIEKNICYQNPPHLLRTSVNVHPVLPPYPASSSPQNPINGKLIVHWLLAGLWAVSGTQKNLYCCL